MRDCLDEDAVRALAGLDGFCAEVVSALQGAGPLVEPKSGLLFLRPVAGVTVVGENRLDIFREIHWARGGGRKLAGVEFGSRNAARKEYRGYAPADQAECRPLKARFHLKGFPVQSARPIVGDPKDTAMNWTAKPVRRLQPGRIRDD